MCIATRDNLSVVFVIHLLVVAVCSNISVRTYVGMLMVVFVVSSSAFDHLRKLDIASRAFLNRRCVWVPSLSVSLPRKEEEEGVGWTCILTALFLTGH